MAKIYYFHGISPVLVPKKTAIWYSDIYIYLYGYGCTRVYPDILRGLWRSISPEVLNGITSKEGL
jgi:hypothetical protein